MRQLFMMDQIQGRVKSGRNLMLVCGMAALAAVAGGPARAQDDIARGKPALQSSTSGWSVDHTTGKATNDPSIDAKGAVDGHNPDGGYHFHTGEQANPWWQVDLQGVYTLSEVRIWNRLEGGVGDRAYNIQVLLSNDGNQWKTLYANNGRPFGGYRGDPAKNDFLRLDFSPVQLALKQTRFVRLQLADSNFLHLDKVEVYGTLAGSSTGGGAGAIAPGSYHAIWSTDVGLYLGLVQTGNRVEGYYYGSDGNWYHVLTGTVTGNVLTGAWDAGIPWFSGRFTFWLAADGRSFQAEASGADGFVTADFEGQLYAAWGN